MELVRTPSPIHAKKAAPADVACQYSPTTVAPIHTSLCLFNFFTWFTLLFFASELQTKKNGKLNFNPIRTRLANNTESGARPRARFCGLSTLTLFPDLQSRVGNSLHVKPTP